MRRPAFKPSYRDQLNANQKALDRMADMAGKPRLALHVPTAARQRARNGADGTPLERDILKAIMQYLSACPSVLWAGRFNRGTAMTGDALGIVRYTKFNTVRGFPDIHGQLRTGAAFWIECKRPGGKLSDDQRDFIDMVTGAGGLAFMAESVDQVMRKIK